MVEQSGSWPIAGRVDAGLVSPTQHLLSIAAASRGFCDLDCTHDGIYGDGSTGAKGLNDALIIPLNEDVSLVVATVHEGDCKGY
jgi:hypothetical protein